MLQRAKAFLESAIPEAANLAQKTEQYQFSLQEWQGLQPEQRRDAAKRPLVIKGLTDWDSASM